MLLIDQRGGHNFDQQASVLLLFLFLSFGETSASIELEEDDVPVLHNVVLALLAITSSRLHCCFRAVLLEGSKLHDLSHNETLLKVCVDPASCLWGFIMAGAFTAASEPCSLKAAVK